MRRPLVPVALAAVALVALAARAQGHDNSIDPGMTKAQVIEHLGSPASVKTADTVTYLFYANSCAKTCGMQDVVMLAHDKVFDAIFRDPKRHYTGQSSSPNMVSAAEAKKQGEARKESGASAAPTPPPPPKARPDTGHATVMPAIVPKPLPVTTPLDSTKKPDAMKTDTSAAKKSDTTAAKPPRE
jgi:outer membrane protein assembly factor BamE (lipoprotein component of BamABCDE complex)